MKIINGFKCIGEVTDNYYGDKSYYEIKTVAETIEKLEAEKLKISEDREVDDIGDFEMSYNSVSIKWGKNIKCKLKEQVIHTEN